MKEYILLAFNRAREFWESISITQRMIIGGVAVVAVAAFIGMLIWLNQPAYDVLFTRLTAEDANRVVKVLEAQQERYKLANDGETILVLADRVQHLRVSMAGENVITGQGVGLEIFDSINIGETDFVQKIKYRRALEGELARTIVQFPNVESARVHLVIPSRSLFIEEQQNPSASVILRTVKGQEVKTKDIMGIINLVTMSVAGLSRDNISVADATTGVVLFEPDQENSVSGLTQTQREHKLSIQRDMERKVEQMLTMSGFDHVVARVNVDLNFNQQTIESEEFDPDKTVVRSEQRSEESTQGSGNINANAPDPNFRADGFTGSASSQSGNRESRTINYEINKVVTKVVPTLGGIDRITAAVIIDGIYTQNADGQMVFSARSAEELAKIRKLVAQAIGFNSARGDEIEVTSMDFGAPEQPKASTFDTVLADYVSRFGKPLLNTMLVFLFLILVVRPVVLALIKPKVEGKMLEGLEGLPLPDERLAIEEIDEEALSATVILDKIEDIRAHALQMSEQNMDQAIGILKIWLTQQPTNLPARA